MSIEKTIIRPESTHIQTRDTRSVEQKFAAAKGAAQSHGESSSSYGEAGIDRTTAGHATKVRFASAIWGDPKALLKKDHW